MSAEFYLWLNDDVAGPFDQHGIVAMLERGEIDAETWAGAAGDAEWRHLGEHYSLSTVSTPEKRARLRSEAPHFAPEYLRQARAELDAEIAEHAKQPPEATEDAFPKNDSLKPNPASP
jgi:hypothetical protein